MLHNHHAQLQVQIPVAGAGADPGRSSSSSSGQVGSAPPRCHLRPMQWQTAGWCTPLAYDCWSLLPSHHNGKVAVARNNLPVPTLTSPPPNTPPPPPPAASLPSAASPAAISWLMHSASRPSPSFTSLQLEDLMKAAHAPGGGWAAGWRGGSEGGGFRGGAYGWSQIGLE